MNEIDLKAYRASFGGSPLTLEDRIAAKETVAAQWAVIQPTLVTRPTFRDRVGLLSTKPEEITLPKHAAGILGRYELTDMLGHPKYLFKYRGGVWYFYGPCPSPGFPGS